MAAAELTETKQGIMHLVPLIVSAQCADAGGDWVVFDGYKGVIPLAGMAVSVATSGEEVFTYGTATINNGGTAYGATDTSIVCSSCSITRTGSAFYLLSQSGEILEVLSDATPTTSTGTFTVRRGCLGTTASGTGLANTNKLAILNIVFLGEALIGSHLFVVLPMPNDTRTTWGMA